MTEPRSHARYTIGRLRKLYENRTFRRSERESLLDETIPEGRAQKKWVIQVLANSDLHEQRVQVHQRWVARRTELTDWVISLIPNSYRGRDALVTWLDVLRQDIELINGVYQQMEYEDELIEKWVAANKYRVLALAELDQRCEAERNTV